MKLESVKSFTTSLDNIHKSKNKYVEENGSSFVLISKNKKTRKSKTLNTQKIAEKAQEALTVIKNQKHLTPEERANLLVPLSKSLKDYQKRVNKSKPWYYCSLFYKKQPCEVLLKNTIQQTDEKIGKLTAKAETFKRVKEHANKHLQKSNPVTDLTHYYLGVIDSVPLTCESLEGSLQCSALKWYVDYLNAYKLEKHISIPERREINHLIAQFEFALEVATMQELIASKRGFNKDAEKAYKSYQKHVLQRIHHKFQDLKSGERLLLPGGYSKETVGHAVMYAIEKNKNGTVSFEIINTGEGSQDTAPIKDGVKNALNEFLGLFTGENKVPRTTVTDIKYSGIPTEKFTAKFFEELSAFNTGKNTENMSVIHAFLNMAFNQENPVKGREHKAQVKGSCTHKSVSATSKRFLSAGLYWDFKVWMTSKEIEKIKKVPTRALKKPEDLTTLVKAGEEKLKIRKAKLVETRLAPPNRA